jgi:hypothetical protein
MNLGVLSPLAAQDEAEHYVLRCSSNDRSQEFKGTTRPVREPLSGTAAYLDSISDEPGRGHPHESSPPGNP